MRICFIAAADSIHSKKWIEFFAKKGHEIHWISLTPLTEGLIDNVKFYQIKGNLFFNIFRIRSLIKKINPDVIHAHYAGVNGLAGAFSGFHPFILTAWGSDILVATKSRIKRFLIKYVLIKADLVTCDAEHMKKAIEELGVLPSKIKIIYFGIDVNKFSPGDANQNIKEKLKIFDSPVVISLRSFEPVYDIETFIRAMPIILKKIPKIIFTLGGKGSQEEKIKKTASDLGVADSIHFLGWISNSALPEYLRMSSVYVSTSLSDGGIAASTAEAMACGVPVVITNSGENEKWITDGKNGFLIPVKNYEILAEKVIYLLENSAEREKLGEAGKFTIREKNNYEKEMEKMENVYKFYKNV